jgi:hypothetical protein
VCAEAIASYELDFLLFTDLGMDFSTYGVAYSRLATYQVLLSSLSTLSFFADSRVVVFV